MFGSFGTPGNERQIPQLFVASGDDHLSDPSLFPWTMGWQPSFREEGRIYANYIQAVYPGREADYFRGIFGHACEHENFGARSPRRWRSGNAAMIFRARTSCGA
ncbi:hypothetical protein LMTR13_14495 [Bradyrhizobium icense]|uniref:Uncharacterized protein n=2 Tax=Bradyrhizobium icense TaxID=1274631 RepID=A0A1B1UEK9_9BRAD|nr:hypothetical protein LMTR13_14495 [Bradyrhizobium icense]